MRIAKMWRLQIFFLLLAFNFVTLDAQAQPERLRDIPAAIVPIAFCELYERPENYDGKIIRTWANLSIVLGPSLHNMDSLYESPHCKGLTVYSEIGVITAEDAFGKKLRNLMVNSQKQGKGRAEVLVQGKFEIAKKSRYGAFSEYRYAIVNANILAARKYRKK